MHENKEEICTGTVSIIYCGHFRFRVVELVFLQYELTLDYFLCEELSRKHNTMAVLKALKQTPGTFWRNPVIALPMIAVVLLQAPTFAAEFLDPFVAVALSLGVSVVFLFLIPFFQGGIIGMANEALDTSTSMGTFFSEGRSNYVSIFGAYLFLIAINIVFGIIAFFLFFFGIVAAYPGASDGGSTLSILLPAAIGLLVGLGYLLFNFFVQFYSQAIVIDDYSAIGGLKHSIGVVRQNLLSTFGYSLLAGSIGIGFGIFAAVISVFASPTSMATVATETLPLSWYIGFGLGGGVLTVLFGSLMTIFAVAFYKIIAGSAANQQHPEVEL